VIPKVAGSIPVSHPRYEKQSQPSAEAVFFLAQASAHLLCHNGGTVGRDNLLMKFCPRCKETKTLDRFYRKKGRLAASYCEICQHAYLREHYRKTVSAYNARLYALHLDSTERNRHLVLEHLTQHPCIDCNQSDAVVLDFDHVRGTKDSAIRQMIFGGTSVKAASRNREVRRSLRQLPSAQNRA
jgi:hypothetical protein